MTLMLTSHLAVWRRLAGARWGMDLNQHQLAKLMDTPYAVLDRLGSLAPNRQLEFSILHRVCATLGITVDQLLAVHPAEASPAAPTDAAGIRWAAVPTQEQIAAVTFENRLPVILADAPDLASRMHVRPNVIEPHRQGSKSISVQLLATLIEQTQVSVGEIFVITFPATSENVKDR